MRHIATDVLTQHGWTVRLCVYCGPRVSHEIFPQVKVIPLPMKNYPRDAGFRYHYCSNLLYICAGWVFSGLKSPQGQCLATSLHLFEVKCYCNNFTDNMLFLILYETCFIASSVTGC